MLKSRRIGRFAISHHVIAHDEETARAVMGRCVIVRCESAWERDAIEYVAISPDFDEVPEHEQVPEYEVHISEGGQRIEFKRSNAKVTGIPCYPAPAKYRSQQAIAAWATGWQMRDHELQTANVPNNEVTGGPSGPSQRSEA